MRHLQLSFPSTIAHVPSHSPLSEKCFILGRGIYFAKIPLTEPSLNGGQVAAMSLPITDTRYWFQRIGTQVHSFQLTILKPIVFMLPFLWPVDKRLLWQSWRQSFLSPVPQKADSSISSSLPTSQLFCLSGYTSSFTTHTKPPPPTFCKFSGTSASWNLSLPQPTWTQSLMLSMLPEKPHWHEALRQSSHFSEDRG